MKKLMLSLFIMVLTTQVFAQDTTVFPAVNIVHNYKYLSSVDSKDTAIPVDELQLKVSDFNVKELDIYTDEYNLYDVYFVIPQGKILASYDKGSNLLRTIERYKNIDLPLTVLKVLDKRFPNWLVSQNIYLVNYHNSDNVRKLYKLTLENGDQLIRVKVDDGGNFL